MLHHLLKRGHDDSYIIRKRKVLLPMGKNVLLVVIKKNISRFTLVYHVSLPWPINI